MTRQASRNARSSNQTARQGRKHGEPARRARLCSPSLPPSLPPSPPLTHSLPLSSSPALSSLSISLSVCLSVSLSPSLSLPFCLHLSPSLFPCCHIPPPRCVAPLPLYLACMWWGYPETQAPSTGRYTRLDLQHSYYIYIYISPISTGYI